MSPLLTKRAVAGLPLDVHFREGDYAHVYCGLTRVVVVHHVRKSLWVSAHKRYRSQACGTGLFRAWSTTEDGFADALEQYLVGVAVRQADVSREGAVQSTWASVTSPWTPFDREAVLGYVDKPARKKARAFAEIAAVRAEIEHLRTRGRRWAPMPVGKVGAKLDQLAVDPRGRLVLIELKHAGASPQSVYYSPLQLLQYVCEWAMAFESVRDGLRALIAARKTIGLSPSDTPEFDRGFRPVIGFGPDTRSGEVRARFGDVLSIANQHLPEGVSPIEVWSIETQTQPVRIA